MSVDILTRIAQALERIAPAPEPAPDFNTADAFVWHVDPDRLEPVTKVNRVDLPLLVGIDRSRDTLQRLRNPRQDINAHALGSSASSSSSNSSNSSNRPSSSSSTPSARNCSSRLRSTRRTSWIDTS